MMLAQLAGVAKNVSVIKRLTFATSFYPEYAKLLGACDVLQCT